MQDSPILHFYENVFHKRDFERPEKFEGQRELKRKPPDSGGLYKFLKKEFNSKPRNECFI